MDTGSYPLEIEDLLVEVRLRFVVAESVCFLTVECVDVCLTIRYPALRRPVLIPDMCTDRLAKPDQSHE